MAKAIKKTRQGEGVGLSPPWGTYFKTLKAVFEDDPDVTLPDEYTEDGANVTIDVSIADPIKYLALSQLLRTEIDYGNVTVKVNLTCSANKTDSEYSLYKAAFTGNRRVRRFFDALDFTKTKHTYMLLENELVQFFNDDLTDYQGNANLLPKDAFTAVLNERHVLEINQVDYREDTDTEPDKTGKPLGEWP